MVDLSLLGWLDGLTSTIIIIFGFIAASIILIKAIKMNARILKYGAIMSYFSVLLWLGPTIDFITILLTGTNLDNTIGGGLYGLLSYMWVAPAIITAMYLGAELLIPSKKKTIIIIYIIIGIVFEFFLFFDTENSFIFTLPPDGPGTALIDSRFNSRSITFLLVGVFLASLVALNAIGSIREAYKSTGVVRKKFIALAIVFIVFVGVAIVDAYLQAGFILFISRTAMIIVAVLLYVALKPD